MKIQLSDHFTYRRLIRFVMPSIIMMIFTSIAELVDGYFVSNFVGKIPFAALNLIWPYFGMLGSVGFMFGTGGNALVSFTMGKGEMEKARRYFSLIILTAAAAGAVMTVFGYFTVPAAAKLLGAEGETLSGCIEYGRVLMFSLTGFILEYTFQSFFVTSGKPRLGLTVMIFAGCVNIVLDIFFIGVLGLGLFGAALATTIAQSLGGFLPVIYFFYSRKYRKDIKSLDLCFLKPLFEIRAILRSCYNGLSELATNISLSLVSMLYNFQLLRFSGENGVAAYGVIMYVNMIFISVFEGYSIGCAPITGYNYGRGDNKELNNIFLKSLKLIAVCGICMTISAIALAKPLSLLYVGYDAQLLEMTVKAFRIYSISYLMIGFNIYASSFFTALSNGTVSATISVLRTFVFQAIAVFVLPAILGLNGIWLAVACSELLALCITIFFFVKMRGRYHYI